MDEFDRESLSRYDGNDGRPAYVAYQGKIYDVSRSKLWARGTHMKRHSAGENLTEDMDDAPHDPEVLKRFRQVGVLKD